MCLRNLQEGRRVHWQNGWHRRRTSDGGADRIRAHAVSPEVYRGFGFPGAEDLGNMFQFNRDFAQAFCGARNPDIARALNPALQTFDVWLAQNKGRIPLE